MRVSDLTGDPVKKRHDIVSVVVHRHPDLQGGAVIWNAALDELVGVDSQQTASIELWFANGQEARIDVNADVFDALATKTPMTKLLARAKKHKRWYVALSRFAHRSLARRDLIGLPRAPR